MTESLAESSFAATLAIGGESSGGESSKGLSLGLSLVLLENDEGEDSWLDSDRFFLDALCANVSREECKALRCFIRFLEDLFKTGMKSVERSVRRGATVEESIDVELGRFWWMEAKFEELSDEAALVESLDVAICFL